MALSAAQLSVDFTTTGADPTERDIKKVGNAVQDADKKGSGFLRGAFSTMTGFLGAGIVTSFGRQIVDLGKSFVFGASDTEEAQSKVNVVFGESADVVTAWADSAAKSFGLSRLEALDTAGAMGNLFTNLGFGRDVAAQMSTQFLGLAGDMSSFFNVSSPEIINAMTSAFVGEYDALQRLGVPINAAAVEQYALNNGIWDGNDALTEQQRVLAVQGLLWENTSNAQGDYARTSDGLANSTRTLGALWSNLTATLGKAFLPVATRVTRWGINALDWVGQLVERFASLRAAGLSPVQAALRAVSVMLQLAFGSKVAKTFDTIVAKIRGMVGVFMQIWSMARLVAIQIGSTLVPIFALLGNNMDAVSGAAKAIAIAIGVFLGWSAITAIVAGLAAAIGLLLSPIVLVIAGIAALGVAWAKNWGDIQGKTAAVVGWLTGTAWPMIQAFGGWVAGVLGDMTGLILPVLTLLDALAGKLNTDFFIPILDWARFIVPLVWDQFLDWLGWSDYVDALDWLRFLVPLFWDSFVDAFGWDQFIDSLDWLRFLTPLFWDQFVDAFDWVRFIAPIVWDTLVTALDWIRFITPLFWDSFVTAFDWVRFITPIVWDTLVTTLDWIRFITPLFWDLFVDAFDWAVFIAPLLWDTFVIALDWAEFIIEKLAWAAFVGPLQWNAFILKVSWHNFISVLKWIQFVPKLTWGMITTMLWWTDFIPEALDWAKFIPAKLSDWADYVDSIDWGDFIPDVLRWPSKEEILSGILAIVTLGMAGGTTPSVEDNPNGIVEPPPNTNNNGPGSGNNPGDTPFEDLRGVIIPNLSESLTQLMQLKQGFGEVKAAYDTNIPPITAGFATAPTTWSVAPTASLAGIKAAFQSNLQPIPPMAQGAFEGARAVAAAASAGMQASVSTNANTMRANVSLAMAGTQAAVALQSALMMAAAKAQGLAMVQNATSAANSMRAVLTAGAAAAAAGVAAGLGRIPGIVASVGGQAVGIARSIGGQISAGFAAGMLSRLGEIQAAANAMVSAAATAMVAKAMISSPSRLFRGLAKWIPAGAAEGVRDGIPLVTRAIGDMFGGYGMPGISLAGAGSGPGGPGAALGSPFITAPVQHIDRSVHIDRVVVDLKNAKELLEFGEFADNLEREYEIQNGARK